MMQRTGPPIERKPYVVAWVQDSAKSTYRRLPIPEGDRTWVDLQETAVLTGRHRNLKKEKVHVYEVNTGRALLWMRRVDVKRFDIKEAANGAA